MKPHQLNAPAAARRVGALTSLAVLALIAGCASSAGIQSEARAIEPQSVGLSSAATPAQAVPADWWRSWGDATLSAVIDQALQSQPSLKVAEARLRRAQAGTAAEEAADGLRINGSADVTRQRFSATSIYPAPLGGSTRIAQSRPVIEPVPGPSPDWPQMGIKVSRHVNDVPAPPFYQRFRHFSTNLDRWFVYDFLLPGTLLMHSGGRPTGTAPDAPGPSVRLHSCQTLTPETETTTHYFFQQSHPVDEGDDTVTESIFNSLVGAFNEDRDMITAQHRNIQLNPALPMMPLAMDAALIAFRRLLEARVQAERNAATCVSLPMFPELREDEVDYVISKVKEWDKANS